MWSTPRPRHITSGNKTRYQIYRMLGGHQSHSGRLRKISPPPGFGLRTGQPPSKSLYCLSYPTHTVQHFPYPEDGGTKLAQYTSIYVSTQNSTPHNLHQNLSYNPTIRLALCIYQLYPCAAHSDTNRAR